ncbi:MAG: transglycosylase SLT domain-containing protein [Gemmatimonadota bacterium]
MPVLIPLVIFVGAGAGVLIALALASTDRPVPVHEPDLPPSAPPPVGFPTSTGYKLVDKILPMLKQAADSSKVPLGVLVGWIAKESGGRLGEVTKLDERGLFQLMPSESKSLGLDHQRLSTDATYSINGGLALIGQYMKLVNVLDVAPKGSEYFWRLVKLAHTMGSGATKKIVAMAQDAGEARTWARLEAYALAHESEILHAVKHSPTKWFPFVDKVYAVGAPFGFGSQDTIVGGEIFRDIIDPLDCLKA